MRIPYNSVTVVGSTLLLLLFSVVVQGNNNNNDYMCAGPIPDVSASIALADVALQVQLEQKDVVHNGDDPLFTYARTTVRNVYAGCGAHVHDKVFVKVSLQQQQNNFQWRGRRHSRYIVFGFLSYGHIPGYSQEQLVLTMDPCLGNRRLGWHDMWTLWGYRHHDDDKYDEHCDVLLPTPPTNQDPFATIASAAGDRLFGNGVLLGGPSALEQQVPEHYVYREGGRTSGKGTSSSGGGQPPPQQYGYYGFEEEAPLYRSAGSSSHGNYNGYNTAVCSQKECGSPPYDDVPSQLCPDMLTTSGLNGMCSRNPATGRCEWEITTCPTCTKDRECDEGGICNTTTGLCAPAECRVAEDCGSSDHFCEGGRCKQCHCDAGTPLALCPDLETMGGGHQDDALCLYVDGSCKREYISCPMCHSDVDCRTGDQLCHDGFCHPAQCTADDQCGPDEVCAAGRCEACQCGEAALQPFECHDLNGQGGVPGRCLRDVTTGQCDYEYSQCPDCQSDSDCFRLPNGYCDGGGRCAAAQCFNDHECLGNEICDEQHYRCVPCDCGIVRGPPEIECHDLSGFANIPGECYRADNGQCVQDYSTCPTCSTNQDCHRLKNGVCINGECQSAQCIVDEECGHDEVCLEHHCVQCDCGPITKQEELCHDEINYLNVPGPCLRENGKCVQEYSTCDACRSDADCSQVYNGVCRGGTCESAECLLSNQCNDSQECSGGFCIACDCGDPIRSEKQCFDGSIAGPDQCIQEGNGNCGWTYTECPICGVDFRCPHDFTCEFGECVQLPAAATCKSAYDCPYSAPYCLGGYCSEIGCYYDGDCGPNEVCGTSGHCRRKQSGVY